MVAQTLLAPTIPPRGDVGSHGEGDHAAPRATVQSQASAITSILARLELDACCSGASFAPATSIPCGDVTTTRPRTATRATTGAPAATATSTTVIIGAGEGRHRCFEGVDGARLRGTRQRRKALLLRADSTLQRLHSAVEAGPASSVLVQVAYASSVTLVSTLASTSSDAVLECCCAGDGVAQLLDVVVVHGGNTVVQPTSAGRGNRAGKVLQLQRSAKKLQC